MGAAAWAARGHDDDAGSRRRGSLDAQQKTPIARERERPEVVEQREAAAAPSGVKSPGKTTQGARRTMTMIGALAVDGRRGLMTIDAPTDRAVLLAFVEQQLVANVRRGDREVSVADIQAWAQHAGYVCAAA